MEKQAMKINGNVGILAYDPIEDKLQCHLCGKWFRGLSVHVVVKHGWTADDYREEFGLNRHQSLICEGTKEILRKINRELGQWKNLSSQTMTKSGLLEFLKGVRLGPGVKLRQQTLIGKSERLRQHNPMNEAEAQERAHAKLLQTWYSSERLKSLSRSNILAALAVTREKSLKIRERNLKERRWVCPCGQAFPTRREFYHHRIHCVIAQQRKAERQAKARQRYWARISPEQKEQHSRHVSEARKRLYASSERMRGISRTNQLAMIAKLRERNLAERRWTCPCGQAFPIHEEAEHHRHHCPIAREKRIEKLVKTIARKKMMSNLLIGYAGGSQ